MVLIKRPLVLSVNPLLVEAVKHCRVPPRRQLTCCIPTAACTLAPFLLNEFSRPLRKLRLMLPQLCFKLPLPVLIMLDPLILTEDGSVQQRVRILCRATTLLFRGPDGGPLRAFRPGSYLRSLIHDPMHVHPDLLFQDLS